MNLKRITYNMGKKKMMSEDQIMLDRLFRVRNLVDGAPAPLANKNKTCMNYLSC